MVSTRATQFCDGFWKHDATDNNAFFNDADQEASVVSAGKPVSLTLISSQGDASIETPATTIQHILTLVYDLFFVIDHFWFEMTQGATVVWDVHRENQRLINLHRAGYNVYYKAIKSIWSLISVFGC